MQPFSSIPINGVYDAAIMNTSMGRPTDRKRTPFGERIVAAREQAGLSQSELADKLGISQRALSGWERDNVALRADQIIAVAEALGVTADYLFGFKAKAQRGGPTGKAKRVFEEVAKLPRHQQDKIIDVVSSFVTAKVG
jgi:transcriptional regulator with XRE-family HTH domain